MRTSRLRRLPDSEPPGPRGSFASGNLAAYEQDRLGFLMRLRSDYGSIARLGARTTVVNDPELALRVLRDRTGIYGVPDNFLQTPIDALSAVERLAPRPLLNAGLRPTAITRIPQIIEHRIHVEIDTRLPAVPEWFDPLPVLERTFSRTIAQFCFGPESEAIADKVGCLLDELAQVIGNPFALPAWTRSPVRRRIQARYRALLADVVSALGARAADADQYSDLCSRVVQSNHDGHPLPRLADMIIGALLAAQRVPAAAGAWLLMLMADHSAVQSTLQAPSRDNRSETEDFRLNEMVLEALRLYPATWMISRTATGPVRLSDWEFRRGHNFLISPYLIHRDPTLFAEPEQFLPERWRTARPLQSAFLTFGSGIHLCPGRGLAVAMLSKMLSTLVGAYKIERAPGTVIADPRTTLLPVGLRIRLTPRHTSSDHRSVAGDTVGPAPRTSQAPAFFTGASL